MTFPATRFTHRFTVAAGRWFLAVVATDSDFRVAAMLLGRNAAVPWRSGPWLHRSLFFGA